MKKKIIIIGAGISGLSAGCYGQMNGYVTEIFELQSLPGGLCTSWNRNGYLIDGCIDWLIGSNPDNYIYDLWNELGVFDNSDLIYHDYILQVEDGSGKRLVVYSDVDKLESHLIELSPDDALLIREFTDAIRKCAAFSKTSNTVFIEKFNKMTMYDFLQQFRDKFLKDALSVCLLPLDSKDYCVGGLIFRLSLYNRKDACWPVGGSLNFAKKIEEKYLSLYGKINYKSEVKEIIIKDDKAIGIRLIDGSEQYADFVLSTIDGHRTLFDLLHGKYVDSNIMIHYSNNEIMPTSMQVSLGIDYDLSDQPHSIALKLDNPLIAGNVANTYLFFKHFCYDHIISNAGKSVITSIIKTDYEYWDNLYNNSEMYRLEKEKICMEFIKLLERRFPQIKGKVQVTDVVTPVTYYRYTGVWKGSYMGWKINSGDAIPSVLQGLKNFYIAGQWTRLSAGIPTAMMSGREIIIKMCIDHGKEFQVFRK